MTVYEKVYTGCKNWMRKRFDYLTDMARSRMMLCVKSKLYEDGMGCVIGGKIYFSYTRAHVCICSNAYLYITLHNSLEAEFKI